MASEYPFEQGPYLSAALLCEKVLSEVDGTKSAIRIVDRVTRQAVGLNPPPEMEPFDYEIFLFIRFKSGSARGPMNLQIKMIKPSGESPAPVQRTVIFEGEDDRGVDVITQMRIKFEMSGVYWFQIILDKVICTRIPFRVVYIPQIMQMMPGVGNPPQAQV